MTNLRIPCSLLLWASLLPIPVHAALLSPEESIKRMRVPDKFRIDLVAAEPGIAGAVAYTFDTMGRPWVVQSAAPGEGKILICRDTDDDGEVDQFDVFADKLSNPTGLAFVPSGLVVADAPNIYFYRIKDDGRFKSEERSVLYAGFGKGNIALQYGHDNFIWAAVGKAGGSVAPTSRPASQKADEPLRALKFGAGIVRLNPDGSSVEVVARTRGDSANFALTETGSVLVAQSSAPHLLHHLVSEKTLALVPGTPPSGLIAISKESASIIPESLAVYTGRAFPKEYWNKAVFTADTASRRIRMDNIEPSGLSFVSKPAGEFLSSADPMTLPTDVQVGPDGCLWFIDACALAGTSARAANAGRLYRVIPPAGPSRVIDLDLNGGAGSAILMPELGNANLFWRLTAQRKLIYRGKSEYNQRLGEIVIPPRGEGRRDGQRDNNASRQENRQEEKKEDEKKEGEDAGDDEKPDEDLDKGGEKDKEAEEKQKAEEQKARDEALKGQLDAIGESPAAYHALWTMQGLDAFARPDSRSNSTARDALGHKAPGVRKAAMAVLLRHENSAYILIEAKVHRDESPQIRLAALSALTEMPSNTPAGGAMVSFFENPKLWQDPLIRHVALAVALKNDVRFVLSAAMLQIKPEARVEIINLVKFITEQMARRGERKELELVIASLSLAPPDMVGAIFDGLAALPLQLAFKSDELIVDRLVELAPQMQEPARSKLNQLATAWKFDYRLPHRAAGVLKSAMAELVNAKLPESTRIEAARRAVMVADRRPTIDAIVRQIKPQSSVAFASGIFDSLKASRTHAVPDSLMRRWPKLLPSARGPGIDLLLSRSQWAFDVLDALELGPLDRTELTDAQLTKLKMHPDVRIARRTAAVLRQRGWPISSDRVAVMDRLKESIKLKGDAAKGKKIYAQSCAQCHTIDGSGNTLGPDLAGLKKRFRGEAFVDILDPNHKIEARYRTWDVTLTDRTFVSGLLTAETPASITLVDVLGQRHEIRRSDIRELSQTRFSAMPEGYESLSKEDLAALLEYIAGPFIPREPLKKGDVVF